MFMNLVWNRLFAVAVKWVERTFKECVIFLFAWKKNNCHDENNLSECKCCSNKWHIVQINVNRSIWWSALSYPKVILWLLGSWVYSIIIKNSFYFIFVGLGNQLIFRRENYLFGAYNEWICKSKLSQSM